MKPISVFALACVLCGWGLSMGHTAEGQAGRQWAEQTGFRLLPPGIVDLPPYHYGMALQRPVRK